MKNLIAQNPISRRAFLKAAALSTAGAILIPTLIACTTSTEYTQAVNNIWVSSGTPEANLQQIIHFATLAPNSHNSQPWKFEVRGAGINIYPDSNRSLAIVDPQDRELYISLGCALENLEIAATQAGLDSSVTSFPSNLPDGIAVTFQPSQETRDNPLFPAISMRQSTRSKYDGTLLSPDKLHQIESITGENGITMHLYQPGTEMDAIIDLVKEGDRQQYADKSYIEELITWLRFNESEAVKTMDGLFSRCSGNPTVPRWLGKRFVQSSKPEAVASQDEEKLRSSSGLILLTSQNDDRRSWLNAGRTYERLALTATNLGIRTALMNQPIEIPDIRIKMGTILLLGGNHPQLLVRFGYAAEMARSLRRQLEQVII